MCFFYLINWKKTGSKHTRSTCRWVNNSFEHIFFLVTREDQFIIGSLIETLSTRGGEIGMKSVKFHSLSDHACWRGKKREGKKVNHVALKSSAKVCQHRWFSLQRDIVSCCKNRTCKPILDILLQWAAVDLFTDDSCLETFLWSRFTEVFVAAKREMASKPQASLFLSLARGACFTTLLESNKSYCKHMGN